MSPSRYRLVIAGELGPRYASAFDGMTLRAHDGETEITGPIIDLASPGSSTRTRALFRRDREGMTFLWILLAILYVACWVYFGLATFRKGHYWLFWIGFIFPILWIIGALMAPTPAAAARA